MLFHNLVPQYFYFSDNLKIFFSYTCVFFFFQGRIFHQVALLCEQVQIGLCPKTEFPADIVRQELGW